MKTIKYMIIICVLAMFSTVSYADRYNHHHDDFGEIFADSLARGLGYSVGAQITQPFFAPRPYYAPPPVYYAPPTYYTPYAPPVYYAPLQPRCIFNGYNAYGVPNYFCSHWPEVLNYFFIEKLQSIFYN